LQRLKTYDGENIDTKLLDEVNKIITNPTYNFNAKAIGGVSLPAGYMCAWALNIVTFNKIFKEVKPLVES
jgi:dynein heavy chain